MTVAIQENASGASKRKLGAVLIPVAILCLLIALFFAFDGIGVIRRRMQSGTAILTLTDNGQVIGAGDYRVTGIPELKPGENGYSFPIDYGEVKGTISTENGEEIEFGFVNPNNWHNVQLSHCVPISRLWNVRCRRLYSVSIG